ncbi:MAG: hypothetical protein KDC38_00485 [Planctomycetes bacterium]|nr:hypothetical protein [Planctomycetota bacterium]
MRWSSSSVSFLIAVALSGSLLITVNPQPALAGSPDFTLRVPDVQGLKGTTVTAQVLLDSAGDPIQGWSFGVCFDSASVTLTQSAMGASTAVVNNGAPPDFVSIGESASGVNMLVVVCYMGCATLGAGVDHEILDLDFLIGTGFGTSSSVSFCETIGDPPTPNLLVVDDSGIVPTVMDGSVESVAPEMRFVGANNAAGYNPDNGLGTFVEPLSIEELPTSVGFPNELQGFSMALAIDPTYVVAQTVTTGPDLAAIDGGTGPDFFAPNISPTAVTVGVVFAFLGGVVLPVDAPKHVVDIAFATNPSTLTGDLVGASTDVVWTDGVGVIPTDNIAVVVSESYFPDFVDATITLVPVPPVEDLLCETQPGAVDVVLTWTNAAVYDSLIVTRDGTEIANLRGTAVMLEDLDLGPGLHQYAVTPVILGASGSPTLCSAPTSPPLTGLVCALAGPDVSLSWDPPVPGYDSIRIFRDGLEIQSLPGATASTLDVGPAPAVYDYDVVGEVAGLLSDPLSCQIEVFDQPSFIRGDSNADGNIDIADPIYNLGYLFQSGPSQCLDAQDVNDDGNVDIADPIFNLSFLFQSGATPLPPYPDCGQDPTEDTTECNAYPPCG